MPGGHVEEREELLGAAAGIEEVAIAAPLFIQRHDPNTIASNDDSFISSEQGCANIREGEKVPQNMSVGSATSVLHNLFLKTQKVPFQAGFEHLSFKNNSITRVIARKSSLRNEFGRAASDTYLISRLSFVLLKFLGIGYRWISKLVALAFYAVFLMPGFLQVGYFYFTDKRVYRSIIYGPKPRNRLDIYLPENLNSPKPVIVFVTGGAWIIGYKAWGALLGLQLVEKDVIVVCLDYRNFPQGTLSDMVEDAMQGISFICNNITDFGGDPTRLYLAGQSAGSHIAACALIEQAIRGIEITESSYNELESKQVDLTWKASQFKGFFGISGCYNLPSLVDHFNQRGLYHSLFVSIVGGEECLPWFSPELRVRNLSTIAEACLPHMYLFHGTNDYSIPCGASESFAEVLASIGAKVTTRFYDGKTHTDIFLQDPLRGGNNQLIADILDVVHAGDEIAQANDALSKPRRLVPEFLLQMARNVSPF
ncbi:hypothetical protein KP509_03G101100 [Ceratopteris richardii]|uniref:protein-S-isoprenylcysteine alpha-carbonyl methylesterase n=1 Tax=Ceratopteris richardii TaxID=49495 RepID=A0A8T2V6N3_CERRI|nr:hypothetical protein KP509_03G101100 [Ceratopteris richardii]KAH7442719.1 hypothetical protein KP509_03G101100 [Ceratopteris richardii]KAH7442723.1 hypothetical protein KP509_03G101100 [Ceratopteris richardii]KAH7442724.1 hypothetical protein KP509_03G101100 [Ceratopteris richardii]KAH7442725.1 hypothetical protein KP509_03G101100 [Ceratopteris richardii]